VKLWLSLIGSVAVAVLIVAGVSALGDGSSAPSVHGPTPDHTPPPPPPPPPGSTLPPALVSSPSAPHPTFVVNGIPIYLPDGAQWTDHGVVTDFGGGTPPPIVELYIGDSWVRFDRVQGTLLEQGVKPTDEAAFRPLIDALEKPIVNSVDDALKIFAPYLSTLALPQSVSHVETTAGQANAMFEPTRVWAVPADVRVWAILARGESQGVPQRDPPPVPTIWVVVAEGPTGAIFVGTDDRVPFGGIDLGQLGTVVTISPSSVQEP